MSGARWMVTRMEQIPHGSTLSELVDWCLQRDLNVDDVHVTGGHLKWESPETPEETDRKAVYQELRDKRHAEWERETYEKLRAKFEGEDTTGGMG